MRYARAASKLLCVRPVDALARLRSAPLRVSACSLRRSIDHGLANSRYGIVLLSTAYLKKEWAQKELDGLFARETAGVKVILPVWHNVTSEFVQRHSPLLAGRFAVNTKEGITKVAEKILRAVE